MAKVSLRIYNREIGTLIDQGQVDEAIGHCHHILKTFPKHLETYKLLGKAYLEAKEYKAASDIFSRVLISVPNDFVSHVGMSLIADETEALDNAIWHMQRAFESQPSNVAVQGELQRLYGRRDGVQPPKIRMTSGALANIYVQGELYAQAIAEIMSVEAKDPDRIDMQVLLANAYFHSGQRVEASQIASNLLAKYPYSFDANRILVDILPETSRAKNTQVYRHRVNALDPYAAFTKGSIFNIDKVPDAAINLERLDWHPGDTPQLKNEWSNSMGINQDKNEDEVPDWLKADGDTPDPGLASASQASPEEDIPDFMRAAGWGNSDGEEEATSFFDSPDPDSAPESDSAEIEQGDMPDWMKSMAPATSEIVAEEEQIGDDMESDEWMNDLLGTSGEEEKKQTAPPQNDSGIDDALIGSLGTSSNDQDAAMNWLESLAANQGAKAEELITDPNARTEDAPEWVKRSQEVNAQNETLEPPAESTEGLPSWMQEEKPLTAEKTDDMPSWMQEEEIAEEPVAATASDDLPSWMQETEKEPAIKEASDIPSWLQDAQGEAPTPDTPSTPPPAADNDLDWLNDIASPAEELPPVAPPAVSADTSLVSDPAIGNLGTSADDQDAAMNWLESLAANQGAKPEELITDPNARTEAAPEWVEQAKEVSESPAPVAEEPTFIAPPVEETADATPSWLQDDAEIEVTAPTTEASPSVADETLVSDSAIGNLDASAEDQDAAMNWLESLAANQGAKPEELITDPNARTEAAPKWVEQTKEVSESPAPVAKEPTFAAPPVEEETDAIPSWLQDDAEIEATAPATETSPNIADETLVSDSAIGNLGASADDQDAAMNWLESLAANQGAKPEELITDPNARTEAAPEWVEQAKEVSEAPAPEPVMPAPVVEDPETALPEEDDVPTWLKAVESTSEEVLPPVAEPAPAAEGDLPSWLADLNAADESKEPVEAPKTESIPDWMKAEEPDRVEPEPTQASEWQPTDADTEIAPEPVAKEEKDKTFGSVAAMLAQGGALPRRGEAIKKKEKEAAPPKAVTPKIEPPQKPKKKKIVRRMNTTMLRDITLMSAQSAMREGNISAALEHYGKMVKKKRLLDETIYDLRESLDDYPIDVSIWQMLGDAYMRAGRLQEAIDAYTKASKLLR